VSESVSQWFNHYVVQSVSLIVTFLSSTGIHLTQEGENGSNEGRGWCIRSDGLQRSANQACI